MQVCTTIVMINFETQITLDFFIFQNSYKFITWRNATLIRPGPLGSFWDESFQRPKCHKICFLKSDLFLCQICFLKSDLLWLCQSIVFLFDCESIWTSMIFGISFSKVCIRKMFKNNVLVLGGSFASGYGRTISMSFWSILCKENYQNAKYYGILLQTNRNRVDWKKSYNIRV